MLRGAGEAFGVGEANSELPARGCVCCGGADGLGWDCGAGLDCGWVRGATGCPDLAAFTPELFCGRLFCCGWPEAPGFGFTAGRDARLPPPVGARPTMAGRVPSGERAGPVAGARFTPVGSVDDAPLRFAKEAALIFGGVAGNCGR